MKDLMKKYTRAFSVSGREASLAAQIAEDLHLNASTVRSRLMRGRRTLREALEKGGLFCENDVG